MRFRVRKDRSLSVLIVALLACSFMLVVLQPVHAAAPAVVNTGHNNCITCTQVLVNLVVANVGDAIVIGWGFVTNSQDQYSTISSITGNNGEVFSQQGVQAGSCGPPTCASAGHLIWFGSAIWSAVATATGTLTFTISWTYTVNGGGAEAFDITNVPAAALTVNSGACNESGTDCATTMTTAGQNAFVQGNAIEIASGMTTNAISSAGSGYTLVSSGNAQIEGEYSATASSVSSPTSFPIVTSGCAHPCGWTDVGAIFGSNGQTATTTINTGCLGGCSGGPNSTSHAPTKTVFTLHFYASQNLQSPAQVDNVSIRIKSANINQVQGTGYIVCYGTSGIPSAGNPYTLITSNAFPIFNQSTNFYVHTNPQALLAANEYYLCGFLIPTTKSNSATITGSGVSVYETSQVGITEYKYDCGGCATPPNTFYSNTQNTPRDWIYIHTIFAVTLITTTSTSTVTGAVTTTVTTTSTSTAVVNQGDPTKAGFWYVPLFYILFFAGVFMAVYAMMLRGRLG
jgi:hypothetical protein